MKFLTRKRTLLVTGMLIVGAAGAAYVQSKQEPKPELKYRTALVDMGNLNQTITATGRSIRSRC